MRHLLLLLMVILSCAAVQAQSNPIPEDTTIYSTVDSVATFPGDDQAFSKFLTKTLRPDVPAKNDAPNGTYEIIMHFKVSKEGTLSDFVPMTRPGYGMEEEVIRVYKKSPKWRPAIKNGVPVNSYRTIRQTFVVSTSDIH